MLCSAFCYLSVPFFRSSVTIILIWTRILTIVLRRVISASPCTQKTLDGIVLVLYATSLVSALQRSFCFPIPSLNMTRSNVRSLLRGLRKSRGITDRSGTWTFARFCSNARAFYRVYHRWRETKRLRFIHLYAVSLRFYHPSDKKAGQSERRLPLHPDVAMNVFMLRWPIRVISDGRCIWLTFVWRKIKR